MKEELEMLQDLLAESKEIYNRNLDNSDKIDSKIVQFFTLSSALLILFIQFIKFPETCSLRFLYVIAGLLFITILILLIKAYKPTGYLSIDPNPLIDKFCKKKYKARKDLIGAIAGTTAENLLSIKENIIRKSKIINVCAYMLVVALFVVMLLNIIQGM